MSETKVFSGSVACGVSYELHQMDTFSNQTEIAMKVEGQVVAVVTIDKKRNGTIEVKPDHVRKVVIKPKVEVKNLSDKKPSVDDIIATN
jgi:hypothetical protein